ncbi:MAG: hypothetical protein JXA11_02790 [Phycisphaerae bacterium]|nr:hypothetical protein [Phycisphaerae bacterium]
MKSGQNYPHGWIQWQKTDCVETPGEGIRFLPKVFCVCDRVVFVVPAWQFWYFLYNTLWIVGLIQKSGY